MTRLAAIPDSTAAAPLGWRRRWHLYMELGKARLSSLVVVTTAVGFIVASPRPMDWLLFVFTLLGTALSALSANALNQCMEVDRDRLMQRTAGRPLPSSQIGATHAVTYGVLCGVAGVGILAVAANGLAAALAGVNILWYLLIYTPMKTRSTLNTIAGAVVGAVPPMIGWSAATGTLAVGAIVLAGVLFVWQIPHFLALAWMYREDYQRGGYRMLPAIDPSGRLTARMALLWALALIPVTLTATLIGATGWLYAAGALLLGVYLALLGWKLVREVDQQRARRLFLASVLYLPLLLGLMVMDCRPGGYGDDQRLADSPDTPPVRVANPADHQPLL